MADERSRPLWRSLLSFALLVGSLVYVAHLLYRERAELGHAFELGVGAVLALTLLMGVSHAQRTYEFTYMLKRLGVREPFVEGFWLTAAGFLLNHLPFNAGLVLRAAILKRDHALPYASYLSLVLVNALINVAVAAALGLASVLLNRHVDPSRTLPLALVCGTILTGSLVVVSLPLGKLPWEKLPWGESFVARRLRMFAQGMELIRGNGSGVALLSVLAFTKILGASVRMWICFGALGSHVAPLTAALLASATIVFSLVNLTPGNLGLREVAMAALATQLGASYAVGMAAASIDRVVLLGYTVLTGVPGLYWIRKRGPFKPSGAA